MTLQKEALDQAGVDQLFVDVASGGKAKLPQLELALSLLRKGDTLVVWRLDRLGRSLGHLIRTVEELGSRGIGFRSLDENIDTTTGTSEPLSHFFAALGQSDRNLIQERTAAGRAAARACGRRGGRKPKLDEEQRAQAATLYSHGLSVDDICATLQIAPSTFFRVRRQGNKRKAGRKPKTKTADGLSTARGESSVRTPRRRWITPSTAPQSLGPTQVLRTLPLQVLSHPRDRSHGSVPSKDHVPADGTAASSRRGLGGHGIAQRDSPRGGGKDAGELEGHPASPEPCLKDRRHRPAHRVRTDTADIASRRLGYSLRGSHPCVARVLASPSRARLGRTFGSGQHRLLLPPAETISISEPTKQESLAKGVENHSAAGSLGIPSRPNPPRNRGLIPVSPHLRGFFGRGR